MCDDCRSHHSHTHIHAHMRCPYEQTADAVAIVPLIEFPWQRRCNESKCWKKQIAKPRKSKTKREKKSHADQIFSVFYVRREPS